MGRCGWGVGGWDVGGWGEGRWDAGGLDVGSTMQELHARLSDSTVREEKALFRPRTDVYIALYLRYT